MAFWIMSIAFSKSDGGETLTGKLHITEDNNTKSSTGQLGTTLVKYFSGLSRILPYWRPQVDLTF